MAERMGDGSSWVVVISPSQLEFEAMRVSVEDLVKAGEKRGYVFSKSQEPDSDGNMIVVGDPSRNPAASRFINGSEGEFGGVGSHQGYEIVTIGEERKRILLVIGGSPIGDVYGLYRIWDGIRVHGEVPELNLVEEPELEIRYTRVRVQSEEDIRHALRYRLNMVFGDNPLRLIDWESEPQKSENAGYRERTGRLARYAHSVGMKFLSMGTDFTFHPSLLDEFNASLSPCDEGFWDAIRAKYRRLMEAVPELDGVCTFTADEQDYWGDYRSFDVMHGDKGCDWSLERRYRTFVRAVWDVIVGEFGKILVHRTWATNSYEQHSQPDIFERIFNDEVPTENLYLVPSFTQNDRWWFQAYNPTLNRTPHDTMVVCESMDYHDAGGNFFPNYPGEYFQAGLESIMGDGKSNLRGASLDLPSVEGWDTRTLTAYTLSRLMWNPRERPEEVARDFSSIYFGEELASAMSEILLLSPVAYKYGLYIGPVTYGEFSSLPHIRTGRFIAEGYPSIDGGKGHVGFLRGIYLRCKPWIAETIGSLDHGLGAAREMEEKFAQLKTRVENEELAIKVESSLRLTRLLVETNNLYVKSIVNYFRYREGRQDDDRKALESSIEKLLRTRRLFEAAPGFNFKLFGVDQLLVNASKALLDLERAERELELAPTSEEIEESVRVQQARYREIIREREDLVKILHWEGRVDGRDILIVKGSEISIEHLRWDPINLKDQEIHTPLPDSPGSVVIEDIESEPMHPFVLQQPCKENGYRAMIYLFDVPGGAHWMKFNLYYLDEMPDELGLEVSWNRREGEG